MIAVFTFCLLTGWLILLPDEYRLLGKHIAASAGFVQNLNLWAESGYFDQSSETKPLLHLWSLGIEEQFYILWPLLIGIGFRLRLRFTHFSVGLLLISFLWNIKELQTQQIVHFYSPLTRFWELLAGAVLVQCQLRPSSSLAWASKFGSATQYANGLSVVGPALIVGALFTIDRNVPMPGYWAALPVLGVCLSLIAGDKAVVNRLLLASRPFVWIGLISYPLYLWHWPLLTMMRIITKEAPSVAVKIVIFCLSLILAFLTYQLIEKPIRYRIKNKARIASVLLIVMLVLGGLSYALYESNGMFERAVAVENEDHGDYLANDSNPEAECEITDASLQYLATFCKQ